mmetsp:Transcript_8339/g.51989  ORF Transcript_8339/g.51989 Transcript_8339/m.51989 type:complete len:238 (+) Transcript_8339:3293-4006(+)
MRRLRTHRACVGADSKPRGYDHWYPCLRGIVGLHGMGVLVPIREYVCLPLEHVFVWRFSRTPPHLELVRGALFHPEIDECQLSGGDPEQMILCFWLSFVQDVSASHRIDGMIEFSHGQERFPIGDPVAGEGLCSFSPFHDLCKESFHTMPLLGAVSIEKLRSSHARVLGGIGDTVHQPVFECGCVFGVGGTGAGFSQDGQEHLSVGDEGEHADGPFVQFAGFFPVFEEESTYVCRGC